VRIRVGHEMKRRMGTLWGSATGAATGAVLATLCASSSEPLASAGASTADAGAMSTFVVHAQRGEVVPPDVDDIEHMCALLTSCDRLPIPPSLIPGDFQTCVTKMTAEMTSPSAINFSLTMRECGLHSNSCASLRACALHGASPDSCAGRGEKGVVGLCDVDGRALSCWRGQVLAVRDCTRGAEQCIVVDGQATCTLGPCPGDIQEGDKPRCSASGTHLLHCEKGKLASLDCAAFGLKCTTAADGAAGCATGGPSCSGAAKRCDGKAAVGCIHGHEVRVDCAGAGLSCSTATPDGGTPQVGACVAAPPPSGACDAEAKATCDGASIRYCNAGTARSYFCKSLGFNRCDSAKGGVRCTL